MTRNKTYYTSDGYIAKELEYNFDYIDETKALKTILKRNFNTLDKLLDYIVDDLQVDFKYDEELQEEITEELFNKYY